MKRLHTWAVSLAWTVLLISGLLVWMNRAAFISRFYIYQGEELNYKAGFVLRNKRASAEERKKNYRASCDYFVKAYKVRQESFNFNRCEYAVDSCLWVEDFEHVDQFRELQQYFQDTGGFKEADSPIVLW